MKTRHVDYPRSAIIVFRLLKKIYRIFRTSVIRGFAYAARVRLPIPRTPHSVAAVSSKPPYLRGEPAAFGTATGIGLSIYFRFGPFNSVPSEIQFSIFNPGTFEKCAVLFVTSVKSFALATAAMNMSSEPIGVPAVSSATLMSA